MVDPITATISETVANGIAGLALVFAIVVYIRQNRVGERQAKLAERMAKLEEERREDEVAIRRSANLSIRFVKYRNRIGQEFIITNHGSAEARNVDLVATSRLNPGWVDDLIARGPLPITAIQAGGETRTPATGSQSVGQPYEIEISWDDDRPDRQHPTHTVSIDLLAT